MKNWKTTVFFTLSAVFGLAANLIPEWSPWLQPISSATLALGGKFAMDAYK